MNQDKLLVETLKRVLKSHNLTYKDVATHLSLTEGSVKRLFANCDFSLKRLQNICLLVGIELSDLFELMQENTLSTDVLTKEQELELVSDIQLLLTAHLLVNKWTVPQILANYDIQRLQMTRNLSKLDRMNIIELLPSDRVRLKVSRNFKWIEDGPITRFFQQHIESEFFNCQFTSAGEIRLFVSGMLSKKSNSEMQRQIKKLVTHFDDLHKDDEKELLSEKYGTSLVVAMRPWDLELFNQYRKPETRKQFN